MKVVNMVVSGKFSQTVSVSELPNSVYNQRKFSGAVCEHQGYTFLVFPNGTFVCLGAKSKKLVRNTVHSFATLLGVYVRSCGIRNMVMSHKLKFRVNLDALYESLRKTNVIVTYENELFNGMVWKQRGGTVRLFHTGSFFVTGLCSKKDLLAVCKAVVNICTPFRK